MSKSENLSYFERNGTFNGEISFEELEAKFNREQYERSIAPLKEIPHTKPRRRIFTGDNLLMGLAVLVMTGGFYTAINGIVQNTRQEDAKLNLLWNQAAKRANTNGDRILDPHELSDILIKVKEGHRIVDAQRAAEGKGPLLGDLNRRHFKQNDPYTGEEVRITIEGLEHYLATTPERKTYDPLNSWQDLN